MGEAYPRILFTRKYPRVTKFFTGTGGDELFGNYRKHSLYQLKLMILLRLVKRLFIMDFEKQYLGPMLRYIIIK